MAGHRPTPKRFAQHDGDMGPVVEGKPLGNRAERRAAGLRGSAGRLITGEPQIRAAHVRNELGYCLVHDRYEDEHGQPRESARGQ